MSNEMIAAQACAVSITWELAGFEVEQPDPRDLPREVNLKDSTGLYLLFDDIESVRETGLGIPLKPNPDGTVHNLHLAGD